jgi:hypothetical protein
MGDVTVRLYERAKCGAKWCRQKVQIPPRKANGTLHLKDDRQGAFQLSWYEERQKQWQAVKSRAGDHPFLSGAIAQAADKSWFLNDRHRDVSEPSTSTADSPRTQNMVRINLRKLIDPIIDGNRSRIENHHSVSTENLQIQPLTNFCGPQAILFANWIFLRGTASSFPRKVRLRACLACL